MKDRIKECLDITHDEFETNEYIKVSRLGYSSFAIEVCQFGTALQLSQKNLLKLAKTFGTQKIKFCENINMTPFRLMYVTTITIDEPSRNYQYLTKVLKDVYINKGPELTLIHM